MSKELLIIDESDKRIVELVTQQIARGASPIELRYFISVCNRTGLDPFARQIWAIRRWDSQAGGYVLGIQTGIDGFRAIANRSGLYEGQTAPQWCGKDGIWKDIWLDSEPPVAAKVGVYKKGFREPTIGIAKYDAVVQLTKDKKPNAFWAKMPDHMLSKCAEAQALRKSFPNECGGLYSEDEFIDVGPELATPGKKAEARFNAIQEKINNPKEETKNIIEEVKAEEEKPKRPRNLAHQNFVINQGPLSKWPTLGKVPEHEAIKWLNSIEQWKTRKDVTIPKEVDETIIVVKEFFGIE